MKSTRKQQISFSTYECSSSLEYSRRVHRLLIISIFLFFFAFPCSSFKYPLHRRIYCFENCHIEKGAWWDSKFCDTFHTWPNLALFQKTTWSCGGFHCLVMDSADLELTTHMIKRIIFWSNVFPSSGKIYLKASQSLHRSWKPWYRRKYPRAGFRTTCISPWFRTASIWIMKISQFLKSECRRAREQSDCCQRANEWRSE